MRNKSISTNDCGAKGVTDGGSNEKGRDLIHQIGFGRGYYLDPSSPLSHVLHTSSMLVVKRQAVGRTT